MGVTIGLARVKFSTSPNMLGLLDDITIRVAHRTRIGSLSFTISRG